MTDRIRLFVVDDHALFREGLIRLLESDETLSIVGSADTASSALEQLQTIAADVVILDYDLGGETALTVVRSLRERDFTGRSLVVTAGLPDRDALELIRLGVCGIFPKKDSPDDLHRNIREVAAGKILIDQTYLQSLLASSEPLEDRPASLTERDKRVLRLLLEGNSNKEIAVELHLSESAVKAALQQLFAKTGVRTRSQLVRIALERLQDEI